MIITLSIFACENGCGTKDQIEVDFHIFLCERGGVKKLRGGGLICVCERVVPLNRSREL